LEGEVDAAGGLVGLAEAVFGEDFFAGQFLGFGVLAVENELADEGEGGFGVGIVVGVGGAGGDGFFVELDLFVEGVAVDHCAEAAVAEGEGLFPERGGGVVPEGEGRGKGGVKSEE
jgi:hypothetical protein